MLLVHLGHNTSSVHTLGLEPPHPQMSISLTSLIESSGTGVRLEMKFSLLGAGQLVIYSHSEDP